MFRRVCQFCRSNDKSSIYSYTFNYSSAGCSVKDCIVKALYKKSATIRKQHCFFTAHIIKLALTNAFSHTLGRKNIYTFSPLARLFPSLRVHIKSVFI